MSNALVSERFSVGAKVLTLAMVAAVVLLVLPYVSGLVGALVLHIAAEPIVARVTPAGRRRGTSLISVLAMFLVLVLPGLWLLVELLAQIPDAIRSVEQNGWVQRLMAMHVAGVDVGATIRQASSDILTWSSRQTVAFIGGAMTATLNLVIALFGAYYLLVSGDKLWAELKAVLPFCPTMSELLRTRFHRATEAMLLGVVLTGASQGALVAAAFAIVGFDHALFWGAVTAVVSLLPIFGSAIVWLPAAMLLLAQQRLVASAALALFGALFVSNVDNALRLVVYKRVGSIHPMITLVGAFAGVTAFGVAGLLLGPLLLTYAIELVTIYRSADAIALAKAA